MTITVDAIYESGVFKPLEPLPDLGEHAKVRMTVEVVETEPRGASYIAERRKNRIRIDPEVAREIGDSHEYDAIEG